MKKLPVGISDFEKIITGNFYYVDKTLLVKEILDSGTEVTLIPRPRRFGKTINLSMLRYFFEKQNIGNGRGKVNTSSTTSKLFDGLAISQHPECMKHQKQYPVIYLTFKDIKQNCWNVCYDKVKELIG